MARSVDSFRQYYEEEMRRQLSPRPQLQPWDAFTTTTYFDGTRGPRSTAKAPKPRVSEKRRADPTKIQYQDLKVGDVLTNKKGETVKITAVDNSNVFYRRENGDEDDWVRNNELLADSRYGWKLVQPKAKVKFEDVIVSDSHRTAISDAIKQVDHHDLIFDTWGFGDIFEKGTAVSMLFYGPPGTGKTLMAQAIADKYDYKLKVIGTAEIESSEPGQAERNIKAYFEGAQKDGKTVLLFDECDSLIHDRRGVGMILAAQINALLTCLENHKGIVIFTTNRLEKMDEAFDRRLSLKLEFEMPDLEQRVLIWKRMFPEKAPLAEDIKWDKLASVEITGGYIKNVVLRSARRAANSEEKKITHKILVEALVEEVKRMEQFQEAVKSNTTPQQRGYTIRKG